MTLAELIATYREIADDKAQPYLASDALVTRYLNEAQQEAARRARLFKDASTAGICVTTATGSTQYIELDPRVIQVRKVKIASKEFPLERQHVVDMDHVFPTWDTVDMGDVCRFIPDKETGVIWFDSVLTSGEVITMTVYREPLEDMTAGGDVVVVGTDTTTSTAVGPEIRPRYQMKLVDWVVWRVLNTKDAEEKYDPVKAKEHLSFFEEEFGRKSSAIDETWIERENMYDEYDGTF